MTNDNPYGFASSDDIELDKMGLPVGTHKVMVIGEEPAKDDTGVIAELEILEGDHKGQKGKVWFLTKHENPTTANIARQNLKRIADATGSALTASAPLKGRVFIVLVGVQKKDERYTEIKRYYPENYSTTNDSPPLA